MQDPVAHTIRGLSQDFMHKGVESVLKEAKATRVAAVKARSTRLLVPRCMAGV